VRTKYFGKIRALNLVMEVSTFICYDVAISVNRINPRYMNGLM
jgi:hypothetical protein